MPVSLLKKNAPLR